MRDTPREQPDQAGRRLTVPEKGDFWLCPKCGELHRFTGSFVIDNRSYAIGELFVRRAADEELEELEEPLRSMLRQQRAQIQAGVPAA